MPSSTGLRRGNASNSGARIDLARTLPKTDATSTPDAVSRIVDRPSDLLLDRPFVKDAGLERLVVDTPAEREYRCVKPRMLRVRRQRSRRSRPYERGARRRDERTVDVDPLERFAMHVWWQ